MFTGLVQAVGAVVEKSLTPQGVMRLSVLAPGWDHRPSPGDSIAVNGCCLTVVAPAGPSNTLSFDAIPQTLRVTTLGRLSVGDRVNLEHAATPMTLLGGHLVQGHVDGIGTVSRVEGSHGGDLLVTLRVPAELARYMIPKGSICLDGVSLTLAGVAQEGEEITVALIPTTLAMTTLREWSPGSAVNLEADATTKTIVTAVHRILEVRR